MFPTNRPTAFRMGTDLIVAFPEGILEGEAAELRKIVAHIFGAPLKTVCADMHNKNVPAEGFKTWRLKAYKKVRLHEPDSNLFMPWAKINVLEDKNLGKPTVSTATLGTIAKPQEPKAEAPAAKEPKMVLVDVQELKELIEVMKEIRDQGIAATAAATAAAKAANILAKTRS